MTRLCLPRLWPCATALVALAALALVWEGDPVRGRQVAAKDVSADLALIPGDCVLFASINVAELDAVHRQIATMAGILDDHSLRVSADQVERATAVLVNQEGVMIVRTSKAYDAKAIQQKLRPGFGPKKSDPFDFKDEKKFDKIEGKVPCGEKKSDDGPPNPGLRQQGPIQEKKVGNHMIEYRGAYERFTEGFCRIDDKVFLIGNVGGMEALLKSKAKQDDDLKAAIARAGKHALVLYFQGSPLRAEINRNPFILGGGFGGHAEPVPAPDIAVPPPPPPPKKCGDEVVQEAVQQPAAQPVKNAADVEVPFEILPFKPLLMARNGTLTADVKPNWKAEVKLVYGDDSHLDDGETALKSAMYTGRAAMSMAARELRVPGTDAFLKPIQTALKNAKVSRKDNTLQTSVTVEMTAVVRAAIMETVLERVRVLQIQNNLKQIGLAMHNHHDAMGYMPGAITNANGKALLSWRVAILPYIEQGNLYRQFKLDEPWDSEHNTKLLAKMPKIYAPIGAKTAEPHSTFFQICTGDNTPWRKITDRPRMADFPDGLSNTFMVVEAGEAVPWTKPADIVVTKQALPKFGAQTKGVFHVGMGDGSVRTMKRDLEQQTLRLLIDPRDGQVLPFDVLDGRR